MFRPNPQSTMMENSKYLNVYSGPTSLQKYFNPDEQPMLPLVELPAKLNPFLGDNVHIFAKMMTALPAQNVKALPALNMLQHAPSSANKTIVEPSSGSTVISLSLAARVLYENENVRAYVTNKTELARLQTLRFFGLHVELYGGPSQPEISDSRGIINKIRQMADSNPNLYNPGQYENEDNFKSHVRWTGPQLLQQLPNINIFCAGMGSAGCVTGTGLYLKQNNPKVTIVGVCNRVGDPVPGPRPAPLFESIAFPWKKVTDAIEEVDSIQSYKYSMELSRHGLICGPSSGMALQGLLSFLTKVKEDGRLHEYADQHGQISCVFPCCDLPYQYLDNYFKKLDDTNFHPIRNEHLLTIDTHLYDPAWELDPADTLTMLHTSNDGHECLVVGGRGPDQTPSHPAVRILDIRSAADFEAHRVYGAVNLPFSTVSSTSISPFEDIAVLEAQWKEGKKILDKNELTALLKNEKPTMVVICYNGESARMSTSILRAQKIKAFSVKGGMPAMARAMVH
ncbi:tryptophan synthase beta subunit-like PLP-dependent enzyme [Bisporella sp. PMI_857]|nr:tryptophan synthase beta subunit-like PLP-dependent enzyme [Bisporella sp. PMI_857]